MIDFIILGVISIFFAYLAQYKEFDWGLKISFLLIFIFLALRYNFGRDYMGYYEIFVSVQSYSFSELFDSSINIHGEIGWLILCKLFKPLGFFSLIAFLSLLNCLIYYQLIKKYVPKNYYWLSMFLYLFNPGLILLHVTAIRQALAISLFLFAIEYLYKKDAVRYFLIIGLASIFHTSALVLLPIYLLTFLKDKISYKTVSFLILIIVILFVQADYLKPLFSNLIVDSFENYAIYIYTQGDERSFLGGSYYIFILTLSMIFLPYWKNRMVLIFRIYTVSFFTYPLSIIILFISRIGMYFDPLMLITMPFIAVALNKKNQALRALFILIVVIRTIYSLFSMFNTIDAQRDYGEYKTIFSAPRS